jgi:MarR family transcriptional regulator, organic hydroperoxide resistance regulator
MNTHHSRETNIHELATIIRALIWQGHKQSVVTMEELGLTLPQAIILLALDANGGRSIMSDLASLTQQSAGTLTGIVDRLITAGLVERERDEEDRRVVWVRLTETGRAKIVEINAQREADVTLMTATFDDAEIVQFTGLMRRLLGSVEASMAK